MFIVQVAKLVKMYFLRTFAGLMINNVNPANFSSDSTLPVWQRLTVLTGDTVAGDHDTSEISLTEDNPVKNTVSFFTDKGQQASGNNPHELPLYDNDWLYGSFAILLFLIVLLRITWPVHLNNLFRSALFPSKGKNENRLFEFRFNSFMVLFLLLYSITYSLLSLSVIVDFKLIPVIMDKEAPVLFFLFSLAFLILISFKILLSRFASWLLSSHDDAGVFYRDHLLVSGFVSSAVLTPLIVVNAFSESAVFLYVAIVLIAVAEIVRVIRSVQAALVQGTFSWFHIFLYFCTLELMPLLIIGKIFMIMQGIHL